MENFQPRLQQLRAELADSAASPENGLPVLQAIRRELTQYYQAVPLRHLLDCPASLQNQFYHARQALQHAPEFPEPSLPAQHTSTEQALAVLEQVTSCAGEQE
jgi:hypothetical protein